MAPGFQFAHFRLDAVNRRLWRGEQVISLNARYFDALVLLVSESGQLIPKDRFLREVWQGIPVTDEALTQCIRTLRRTLGDRAGQPEFIETVPKHGYRFICPVHSPPAPDEAATMVPRPSDIAPHWRSFFGLALAGTVGAGIAGLIGGLLFGLACAAYPMQTGPTGISVFLVVMSLTLLMALIGGAGLSFGIAASSLVGGSGRSLVMLGGAAGGLVVGGSVKLLGLDAFELLLGQSPGDITGAAEGIVLGAAVGYGAWLGWRKPTQFGSRRHLASTALVGLGTGMIIPPLGGRLMAGSLDLLANSLPQARLRLDALGLVAGENHFGPISQVIVSGLEGALFVTCIVGAMALANRWFDRH